MYETTNSPVLLTLYPLLQYCILYWREYFEWGRYCELMFRFLVLFCNQVLFFKLWSKWGLYYWNVSTILQTEITFKMGIRTCWKSLHNLAKFTSYRCSTRIPEHYFKWLVVERAMLTPFSSLLFSPLFLYNVIYNRPLRVIPHYPPSPPMSSLSSTNTQSIDNNTPSLSYSSCSTVPQHHIPLSQ
jgi:hypothetical protein